MNLTDATQEQQRVINMMRHHKAVYGVAPSLTEIMRALGYTSKSSAQYQVNAIKRKGLLDLIDMPETMVRIPLVGNISCGLPLLAEENIEGWIPVEASRLKKQSARYFFLRANGDSMNQADIEPGDFVLIRQQPTASLNDIIVALLGDYATLKKLSKTKDGVPVLLPCSSNPAHKPQIMLEDFSVGGVFERVFKPKTKEALM